MFCGHMTFFFKKNEQMKCHFLNQTKNMRMSKPNKTKEHLPHMEKEIITKKRKKDNIK